jgi:hypothetical protein
MSSNQFMIGDIIHTYFKNLKYHGIVINISGDYCYVEFFDSPPIISSLPLYYSSITKVSE